MSKLAAKQRLALSVAIASALTSLPGAAQEAGYHALEEVLVTARKRSESV